MVAPVLTWICVAAFWMLLVDTADLPELVAGALAATAASILSELVRRQRIGRARPTLRWLVLLPSVLASVPRHFALLARALIAGQAAEPGWRTVPAGVTSSGDRARVEYLGSLAPNSIVLGISDGEVLLHQLARSERDAKRVQDLL